MADAPDSIRNEAQEHPDTPRSIGESKPSTWRYYNWILSNLYTVVSNAIWRGRNILGTSSEPAISMNTQNVQSTPQGSVRVGISCAESCKRRLIEISTASLNTLIEQSQRQVRYIRDFGNSTSKELKGLRIQQAASQNQPSTETSNATGQVQSSSQSLGAASLPLSTASVVHISDARNTEQPDRPPGPAAEKKKSTPEIEALKQLYGIDTTVSKPVLYPTPPQTDDEDDLDTKTVDDGIAHSYGRRSHPRTRDISGRSSIHPYGASSSAYRNVFKPGSVAGVLLASKSDSPTSSIYNATALQEAIGETATKDSDIERTIRNSTGNAVDRSKAHTLSKYARRSSAHATSGRLSHRHDSRSEVKGIACPENGSQIQTLNPVAAASNTDSSGVSGDKTKINLIPSLPPPNTENRRPREPRGKDILDNRRRTSLSDSGHSCGRIEKRYRSRKSSSSSSSSTSSTQSTAVQRPLDVDLLAPLNNLSKLQISPARITRLERQKQAELERKQREADEAAIAAQLQHESDLAEQRAKEQAEREARKVEEERRSRNYRAVPKIKLLPKLDQEWEQRVDEALQKPDSHQFGQMSDGTPVTRRSLATILPTRRGDNGLGWLNDEMIAGYLQQLVDWGLQTTRHKRGETPKYHAFLSSFWTNLSQYGPAKVERWSKRAKFDGVKMLAMEYIFIPINPGAHWTLLAISPRRRTVEYFDSLDGASRTYLENARAWLRHELKDKFFEHEWRFMKGITGQQDNARDCGVFTVTNAKMLVGGWDPERSFAAADMPTQRRRMVAELLKGRFEDEFEVVLSDDMKEFLTVG